ncbi:DUF4339 domain-containing protein [Gimesia aquarii]|uniref:GYF domain-containing protein n=1 Tax=Gimesia aquarii TaxID=2527964 RepID=A0A517VU34_9PLAN|nr:DUF4339 domain-containing protein [Gimesia aquarii]QDT96518.1 hypothetical protein V144x_19750 [Gimesia aquarii]
MATEWYYKQSVETLGPYTFYQMIEMVREEQSLPETMVRPNYMDEWQWADSVVGLFHMPRLAPATLPPVRSVVDTVNNNFADADDSEDFLAESDDQESTAPIQERILEHDTNFEHDSEVDLNDEVEFGAYSDETWVSTLNTAVERIDVRAPKQEEPSRSRQIVPTMSLSFLECLVFRKLILVVAMLLCASAGIYGFVNWSEKQNMIVPSLKPPEAKLIFPLIGEYSSFAYWKYFVDSDFCCCLNLPCRLVAGGTSR